MQNQLHGMLCQAAGIFAEEGFRQEGRMAAMGSEEAAPGLTLFNLMQCVLAIDCQCYVEDTGIPVYSQFVTQNAGAHET